MMSVDAMTLLIERPDAPVRQRRPVIGIPVDVVRWNEAIERIFDWASRRESRAVCVCNVHNLVTARRNPAHAEAVRSADLVTPDGAPVAWMLRKHDRGQERISGPDLMWACCANAAQLGTEIFLYGGTQPILRQLLQRLSQAFPGLRIAGAYSPPFRELSAEEDSAIVDMINSSGARMVWVGLGCPKQEAWLHAHRGRIHAVMLGVGAAFDFHAGAINRAPAWMQRGGLEWLHRLSQEPRRLARRYFVTNTLFIMAAMREVLFGETAIRER
jgi:N-acetylglucosaminyldiphosphoundecaprenol N-acetyl-beta-D-mannosaminyltransferase